MARKKVTDDMVNSFVDLRETHDKSLKKIGDVFDVSASTVKKNLDDHYRKQESIEQQDEIDRLRSQLDKKTGADEFLNNIKDTMKNRGSVSSNIDYIDYDDAD